MLNGDRFKTSIGHFKFIRQRKAKAAKRKARARARATEREERREREQAEFDALWSPSDTSSPHFRQLAASVQQACSESQSAEVKQKEYDEWPKTIRSCRLTPEEVASVEASVKDLAESVRDVPVHGGATAEPDDTGGDQEESGVKGFMNFLEQLCPG